jgi:hypothetical protein
VGIAALAAIAWTPSLSQLMPRFGVAGGANLATLSSDFIQHASNRAGFAAGVMAVLPVSSSFAIQPELVFTRKGTFSKPDGTGGAAKIDYIELPMLARYDIRASGRAKLFVYSGPGFSYRTNCTIEGPISIDCDALARQAAEAVPGAKFSRTDLDGIVGGGVAFDVGGTTMTVSVRYDVGFVKVISYSDSKNRVLSFLGTLEWPFHK